MIRLGPLVQRYEDKHAYFKQLANSMGNFINIPYVICILIPMNSPDGHTTLKLDQVSSFA